MTLLTNIDEFYFVVSFNKHLLNFSKVPGPFLGSSGTSENKTDKCPCSCETYILSVAIFLEK